MEQKLEWIRDKNIELAIKLKQVERRLQGGAAGKEKLSGIQGKLKEAIHKLNEAAGSLILHLDKNEEAEIVVKGKVYPGTYIEICHLSYVVNREMGRMRFKLDKVKGRIAAGPISSG